MNGLVFYLIDAIPPKYLPKLSKICQVLKKKGLNRKDLSLFPAIKYNDEVMLFIARIN
ncbi:hypothetical protein [Acinetobacter sp. ANC 3813]|uniref:hypothetical protein n=1 Tax=Acinetobacter sp. ANC 3813 TaxID=1977873 RepID=UPI00148A786C|nr:hypothetical protein [Acinetobacter sp. ANC 3813]